MNHPSDSLNYSDKVTMTDEVSNSAQPRHTRAWQSTNTQQETEK